MQPIDAKSYSCYPHYFQPPQMLLMHTCCIEQHMIIVVDKDLAHIVANRLMIQLSISLVWTQNIEHQEEHQINCYVSKL